MGFFLNRNSQRLLIGPSLILSCVKGLFRHRKPLRPDYYAQGFSPKRHQAFLPPHWAGQCFKRVLSFYESLRVSVKTYSRCAYPLTHCSGFSLNGHEMVITLIAALLSPQRPIAILRSIAFVVIASFNAVFWSGSRPHVGVKLREIRHPLWTYGYAPSAIIVKSQVFRVGTARLHATPDIMFRRARHPVGSPWLPPHFFLLASATLRISRLKGRPGNGHDFSAHTQTEPITTRGSVSFFDSIKSQDHQPRKRFSSNVFEIGSALDRILRSHAAYISFDNHKWFGESRWDVCASWRLAHLITCCVRTPCVV